MVYPQFPGAQPHNFPYPGNAPMPQNKPPQSNGKIVGVILLSTILVVAVVAGFFFVSFFTKKKHSHHTDQAGASSPASLSHPSLSQAVPPVGAPTQSIPDFPIPSDRSVFPPGLEPGPSDSEGNGSATGYSFTDCSVAEKVLHRAGFTPTALFERGPTTAEDKAILTIFCSFEWKKSSYLKNDFIIVSKRKIVRDMARVKDAFLKKYGKGGRYRAFYAIVNGKMVLLRAQPHTDTGMEYVLSSSTGLDMFLVQYHRNSFDKKILQAMLKTSAMLK